MAGVSAAPYLWWLVSRAAGIVAFGLISISVLLGLTMATRLLQAPAARRALVRLHEHIALAGLSAIGVHGLSLLADPWLHPGLLGVTVPLAISYRPEFTAAGILAAYAAAILGLSFYLRRRIGARRWRSLHRASVLVWVLGVIHTLGAGTDASATWLRAIVLASALPISFLTALRLLGSREQARRRTRTSNSIPPLELLGASERGAHAGQPVPRRPARPLADRAT